MDKNEFRPAHINSKLDSGLLYLHEHAPRTSWIDLQGAAAFWLGVHHSLRRRHTELERLGAAFLDKQTDWADYRMQTLYTAAHHLGNLHSHHHVEDNSYFPRLRRQEPKLCRGFDLLDSDHEDIEGRLKNWEKLIGELKVTTWENRDLAARLHQSFTDSSDCLMRHLSDEEDLVIPVLALYS
ncbi:MAG: hemerythrin domain-containing protein [Neisseria sp.]|nr:hemerythrin domain-containing protein [Neisseria sp.]